MPWSGSGTYSLPPAYSPEVNGTTIDAARYNGLTGDVATGITACLAKNGENVPTANLPMGGFRHTGAADGTASGQYIAFAQATAANIAGAWSAAALIPTGSTVPTNGMYLPAASTLGWAVGSTEYMRLTSTTWTLQANGTLNNSGTARRTVQFTSTGGDAYIGIESSAGGAVFTGSSAYATILGSNNATAVQVGTNGAIRWGWSSAGHLSPIATSTYDIGTTSLEARNVYTVSLRRTTAGALVIGSDDATGTIQYRAGGAEWFNMTADGRFYGLALHNNAGAVTGTTNQYIASGTYTPTLSSVSNVSATTSNGAQWTRTGNVVTVSGSLAIDPTSTNTFTEVGISLPIASNFTQTYHCAGTAVGALLTSNPAGTVAADTTNDRASLTFTIGTDVTNNNWFFTFTYLIL